MYLIILLFLSLIIIEINHILKRKLSFNVYPKLVDINKEKNEVKIKGYLSIQNPYESIELMLTDLRITPKLLGSKDFSSLSINTQVEPSHKDTSPRPDKYWSAYIVKSKASTDVFFTLSINDNNNSSLIESIDTIWLEIDLINYGPSGRHLNKSGFSIAISKPLIPNFKEKDFLTLNSIKVITVRTHMLGVLDDPIKVLRDYTQKTIDPDDLLVIGETPLAIMQGRYIHPANINPGFLSKLICRSFHPTSSLATACGMQTLINTVGPTRVIIAWIFGAFLKMLKIKGFFYRMAGSQARLIDDITGTTPPYDQTIVLGPSNPLKFCTQASSELGVNVAVVDVNDLGRVKVLASSNKNILPILKKALQSNPAGNGDEKTPILIIRPSNLRSKA